MQIQWEVVATIAALFGLALIGLRMLFGRVANSKLGEQDGEDTSTLSGWISPEPGLPPPNLVRNNLGSSSDSDLNANGTKQAKSDS